MSGKVLPLIVAAALVSALGCGGKDATSSGESTRIIFVTDPPGATLIFDGEEVGVTPVTLEGVGEGKHTYTVRMEGYLSESSSYVVTSPGTKRIEIKLKRLLTISVNTDPPGAKVFLDQLPVDGTTPLRIDGVTEGSHNLRIKLKSFFEREMELEISEDINLEVTLYPLVKISEVKLYAWNPATQEKSEEATSFPQAYFSRVLSESKYRYVMVKALFDKPSPCSFEPRLRIYLNGEKLKEVSAIVQAGDMYLKREIANPHLDYYMEKGNYMVEIYYEDELLGTVSFTIK